MKACVPRSIPLAQLTREAAPGNWARLARRVPGRLRGRGDQDGGAGPEFPEVGGRSRGGRQPHPGQLAIQPRRLEGAHPLFAAAPNDDLPPRRGGRVGERRSPGPGPGHPDNALARHGPCVPHRFSIARTGMTPFADPTQAS